MEASKRATYSIPWHAAASIIWFRGGSLPLFFSFTSNTTSYIQVSRNLMTLLFFFFCIMLLLLSLHHSTDPYVVCFFVVQNCSSNGLLGCFTMLLVSCLLSHGYILVLLDLFIYFPFIPDDRLILFPYHTMTILPCRGDYSPFLFPCFQMRKSRKRGEKRKQERSWIIPVVCYD